jgi:RHS repeat-associated protein
MTDASGTVVWEAGYMPFGEARVLVADIVNNLRFPGQYFDAETGFHYNRHRYYDPDTGRYLTPDPIGLDGGMNLYVYVDGNPVNRVDPYGLIPLDTIWDIGNVIIDIVTGDKESLIFDSAAMMIPYLPAGATKVCKVGKAAKKPYTPNRRLPRNPKSNAPVPDVDVPHSQIGKPSDPKFGDYRQARTWDYGPDGRLKPKKDIDFTDHNNPLDHINPHQHRWSDEHHFPGKRGKQEPLN